MLLSHQLDRSRSFSPDSIHPILFLCAMPNSSQRQLPESFETRAKREDALRILESNELLFWYSSARNESVPQTRLHFSRILANLPAPPSNIVDLDDDEIENKNDGDDGSKGKRAKVASPSQRPISKPTSRVNKGTGSGSGSGSGSGTGSAGPSSR